MFIVHIVIVDHEPSKQWHDFTELDGALGYYGRARDNKNGVRRTVFSSCLSILCSYRLRRDFALLDHEDSFPAVPRVPSQSACGMRRGSTLLG